MQRRFKEDIAAAVCRALGVQIEGSDETGWWWKFGGSTTGAGHVGNTEAMQCEDDACVDAVENLFPVSDWQGYVINDDLRQGYWDWVESELEVRRADLAARGAPGAATAAPGASGEAPPQLQTGEVRPLKKTTIVIWSEVDDPDRELSDLAREAEVGDAYCARLASMVVNDPQADPDWDGTEFFGEDEAADVLPPWASALAGAPPAATAFVAFVVRQQQEIETLMARLESKGHASHEGLGDGDLDEMHWDAVAELKTCLGAAAANDAGDDDDAQDDAIEEMEAWVADTVSHDAGHLSIAAMLMTLDRDEVLKVIDRVEPATRKSTRKSRGPLIA